MADPEPRHKGLVRSSGGRRAGAEAAKIMISLLDSHARHVIATVPPSSNLARKQLNNYGALAALMGVNKISPTMNVNRRRTLTPSHIVASI
jgi:hypothetical protein